MSLLHTVLAICIGACAGALSRFGLSLWLNPGGLIPWGTVAANLIGGYLVGVCVATFGPAADRRSLAPAAGHRFSRRAHNLFDVFSGSSRHAAERTLRHGHRHSLLHLFGSLLLTVAGIKTAMFFIAARAQ